MPERIARIIFRGALEQTQYDIHDDEKRLPEKSNPYSCFSILLLATGVTMPSQISDAFNYEHIQKLFPLAKERPGISSLETTIRSYKHFPIGVALYTENAVPEHAFLVLGIDEKDRILCFDKAGKFHYRSTVGGYSIRTPEHIMRGYPNATYISLRRL